MPKRLFTNETSPVIPSGLPWTCPRLIMRIASTPCRVAFAERSVWKPFPGSVILLSEAWSDSIRLFYHFLSIWMMASSGPMR